MLIFHIENNYLNDKIGCILSYLYSYLALFSIKKQIT